MGLVKQNESWATEESHTKISAQQLREGEVVRAKILVAYAKSGADLDLIPVLSAAERAELEEVQRVG